MSRDEVLQHVQTFTEIRRDGGFNDRPVWLGHQSAHTGQLADLGSGTSSARIGHHVYRVEGLLLDCRFKLFHFIRKCSCPTMLIDLGNCIFVFAI